MSLAKISLQDKCTSPDAVFLHLGFFFSNYSSLPSYCEAAKRLAAAIQRLLLQVMDRHGQTLRGLAMTGERVVTFFKVYAHGNITLALSAGELSMSYCTLIDYLEGEKRDLHKIYHDQQYGFPIQDDNELFCRLVLEINQAGLSWETILKKQDSFRKAYSRFNINKVAAYSDFDRKRLLADAGIIRNRLKVNAAIENAKAILVLQKEHGSFKEWLYKQHPLSKAEWVKLFKKTFRFTGGEIVNEFLMSIGILPGAHDKSCPIYKKTLKAKPLWVARR